MEETKEIAMLRQKVFILETEMLSHNMWHDNEERKKNK